MNIFRGPSTLVLTINGERRKVVVEPHETLLDLLRSPQVGLTGAKPGCENGDCGACTILLNQKPAKSCMMFAVDAEGQDLVTVEGLVDAPVQRAFLDHFAFQCGYCTSGFLMAAQALLLTIPHPDPHQITEWLRSNICRCTSYEEILQAVREASER
ncbi:MAG: (2Fe-2S)-binding protein [Firmicutes bacterium]|nr:(2Fe-2S)-binding protein [Bacillota bacterium]